MLDDVVLEKLIHLIQKMVICIYLVLEIMKEKIFIRLGVCKKLYRSLKKEWQQQRL